jgi:hypothetical protein
VLGNAGQFSSHLLPTGRAGLQLQTGRVYEILYPELCSRSECQFIIVLLAAGT